MTGRSEGRIGLVLLAFMALVTLLAGVVAANDDDGGSKLEVHGFITQAYATTDLAEGPYRDFIRQVGNGLSVEEAALGIPEDGTFDYRSLALQFRYEITEKDIVVIQLSSEANGESPVDAVRDDVELDWGFYERRIGTDTRIRAGRVQIPYGIYNELRDVGTTLPFYRPAQSIYLEGFYTSETLDGLSFSHVFAPDSDWSLELDLYLGEFEGLEATLIDPTDVKTVKAENAFGAQLWLNTPVSGLRFGLGGLRRTLSGGQEGLFRPVGEEGDEDEAIFSIEGAFDRWSIRAEHRWFSPTLPSPFGGEIGLELTPFYIQLGAIITDNFHAYLQFEEQDVKEESVDYVKPLDYIIRKDLGIALNYFFSANVLLKAEYHWVEAGGSAPFPVFTPTGPKLDALILDSDDGNYAILALSVSF